MVSAPPGTGKTTVFELAILKLFNHKSSFQCVYLAPTKALCSERFIDWSSRFLPLNISVGLLTGDTEFADINRVKRCQVIIATPEKWDVVTRKWTGASKSVELLLVDEVHFIKDPRGATLEVVVTRMKTLYPSLIIIALSATIPNINDLSVWIAHSDSTQSPAKIFSFDDSCRSVAIDKKVFGYKLIDSNIFLFDNMLSSKLNWIIREYGERKPVIVFCPTRKSAEMTAKYLAKTSLSHRNKNPKVKDKELQNVLKSDVVYHHAGLLFLDRTIVENMYLRGQVSILCSTSTLSVGVNLPTFLVIIKGTKCWAQGAPSDYSEADMIQMIGRSGRPQFENSGRAIILTTTVDKSKYEMLLRGSEKVESSLDTKIHEHLAAEVSLGVIKSNSDILRWLKSTFFYVRFLVNPWYYSLVLQSKRDSPNLTSILEVFCENSIMKLSEFNLVTRASGVLEITDYGRAMVKHYIAFDSMKQLLQTLTSCTVEDCLNLLTSAYEFHDIHLKHNEIRFYKQINSSLMIKFGVDESKLLNQDKVSLLIQFELGGLEYPQYKESSNLYSVFINNKILIFKQALRICCCMKEVFALKKDAISLVNCLFLNRCIQGKAWEDTPIELRQLEGIGLKDVQKFVDQGVTSLVDAKGLKLLQIVNYLGVNIVKGRKIIAALSNIPMINLDLTLIHPLETFHDTVHFRIKLEIVGTQSYLLNSRSILLNVVTKSDNGTLVDFKKISTSRFGAEPISFELLTSLDDMATLDCQVSAEKIPGISISKSLNLMNTVIHVEPLAIGKSDLKSPPSTTEEEIFQEESDEINSQKGPELSNENATHILLSMKEELIRNPKRKLLDVSHHGKCGVICNYKKVCRHSEEAIPTKSNNMTFSNCDTFVLKKADDKEEHGIDSFGGEDLNQSQDLSIEKILETKEPGSIPQKSLTTVGSPQYLENVFSDSSEEDEIWNTLNISKEFIHEVIHKN